MLNLVKFRVFIRKFCFCMLTLAYIISPFSTLHEWSVKKVVIGDIFSLWRFPDIDLLVSRHMKCLQFCSRIGRDS